MGNPAFKYNFGIFNPTNAIQSIHMIDIGYHDHTVVKNYITKPRVQHYDTFHIVLEGQGTLKYKNKTYKLSAGSVFYLPRTIEHLYLPKESDPYKFVWIGVNGDELPALLKKKNITENNPLVHLKNAQKTVQLCKQFIETHTQANITEEKMLSFFFSFIDTVREPSKPKDATLQFSQYIDQIKMLIDHNHMFANFSIDSIASALHLSHSWLCALFKKEMGMSMQQYLISVRINKASVLLIETSLPVNEIAYSCGFTDALYFSALFKKRQGHSPSQYRKKYAITK